MTTRPAKVFQHDELIGTLKISDCFRPTIDYADLACVPGYMIGRSRSWLFEVGRADLRLELRGEGECEEVVVIAERLRREHEVDR